MTNSYSPEAVASALDRMGDSPFSHRLTLLIGRLFFRGIYFPQMGARDWTKLLVQNRRAILALAGEAVSARRARRKSAPAAPAA